MSVREELATAATEVDGVQKVTPYYRQSVKPGDGWVSWQRADRDDTGFGFMDRWAVTIALPQDTKAAETWIEEHLAPLEVALGVYMIVTAFIPSVIRLDSVEVNALVIEGTRAR